MITKSTDDGQELVRFLVHLNTTTDTTDTTTTTTTSTFIIVGRRKFV